METESGTANSAQCYNCYPPVPSEYRISGSFVLDFVVYVITNFEA